MGAVVGHPDRGAEKVFARVGLVTLVTSSGNSYGGSLSAVARILCRPNALFPERRRVRTSVWRMSDRANKAPEPTLTLAPFLEQAANARYPLTIRVSVAHL